MADAAVDFLLGNLQQLLLHHINLISGARQHVETLEGDLRLFKSFLKGSIKKRRDDPILREYARQILDVVYKAEDIIDAFVTKASIANSQNYFLRAFNKPVDLHEIALRVNSVGEEVKRIYGDAYNFAALGAGDGGAENLEIFKQRCPDKEDHVVGFEDEAKTIIGYIMDKKDNLDVISIVGMPGQGKTTLAGKIFHDDTVKYEYPTRIWVYVSQEFTIHNVCQTILRQLSGTEQMNQTTDGVQLATKVRAELEKGKFLIVMDDVWAPEDWDGLLTALPKNKGGKVLITSRNEQVARYANPERSPHKLRFLTNAESWSLLNYEVFRRTECPAEFKGPGTVIVKECGGLPLAIVVIGGILVQQYKASDDMKQKRDAWEAVSKSVDEYLAMDPQKRMEKIIALSYDKLPNHLRACFLYMGMFPEDFEIPVWKLTRMWIAEGFIQQKGDISVEEIAEIYLNDLISMNLVSVDKRRPNGRVKTCRIHDLLRDFCIREAGNGKENFLQEIKKNGEGFQYTDGVQQYRRICIHSDVSNFFSKTDLGSRAHVRSFVCFSKDDVALLGRKTSAIPAAFKLLRVLDIKPIKYKNPPGDMDHLLHLRYIVLSFNSKILPPSFSKLWNLETLIAETSSRTLEIRADLWKLRKLRHLKTNASSSLPKAAKSSQEENNLRTLGTISPESCTDEVIGKCHKLKKLGIRGKLNLLLDGRAVSFETLGKLESLEKLKLLNDAFPLAASEDPLASLPKPYQFPQNLKSLTLSDTFLDWKYMNTLRLLDHLEVLKLKEKAFMGTTWKAEDGGFRHLEFLLIGRTDLINWEASSHHYPSLRWLQLHNCEKLQELPVGLADITTFQVLDLLRSCTTASESAVEIRDKKKSEGKEFKLTIFPPLPPPRQP